MKKHYDQIIPLKGQIIDGIISLWWLGKWRTVRKYQGKSQVPSQAIVDEILTRFRLNANLVENQAIEINWID